MPVDSSGLSDLRYAAVNPALVAKTKDAVAALFPITSDDGKLEIRASNVTVHAEDFDAESLNKHQDARQKGETLGADITADLELWRDGKKAQSIAAFNLGTLPLMTALGSFLQNGADYFVPLAQLRLKSGAYSREKANGEYETMIRTKTGAVLTVWMEPDKGILKLGLWSSNVAWYSIVKALGASDDQIIRALGNDTRARDLFDRNKKPSIAADVTKFFLAIFERKLNRDLLRAGIQERDAALADADQSTKIAAIKQWFAGQEVDPYVTKKTMGTGYDTVTLSLLLDAGARILGIARGMQTPDDRDSLEFKTAHGVDDLLPERIARFGRLLRRKLLQRLGKPDTTLAKGFGKDWLSPATTGFFGGTRDFAGGIANTAEAANPLAILGEQSKLIVTGEGGIGEERAITTSARLFRPSNVNFIDPVRTAEGQQVGIVTHAAVNVRKVGNTLEAPFYKVTDGKADFGKPVWLNPMQASDAVVAYPEYFDRTTGRAVSDLVRVNKDGAVEMVPSHDVQYLIPSGVSMLDDTSNIATFFDSTHSNRGMMAGKHLTQALPLTNRELPLVEMKDQNGTDVLRAIGKTFTVASKVNGKVTEVTPTHITVGDTKHELYDGYAMQSKVALDHTPVVKVGDTVKKGDLLADSNYSKDGKLALGVNLLSGYMPWKNATNFEDAIVISQAAAQKLSSDHLHRLELVLEKGIVVDKKLSYAQYPTIYTRDSLGKIGDDGVVKQGSTLKPGDIVIAAVMKATIDPRDRSSQTLGNIHKSLEQPYRNSAVMWNEIFQGKVQRVVHTSSKIEVYIRTIEPMQVGDKLSMSSAAKGTVAAIMPDEQMPRRKDGSHLEIIFNTVGVAGRINPSQTIEQAAGKIVKELGKPYSAGIFDGVEHAVKTKEILEKAGKSQEEELFDPETGKWLEKPVGVGYNYVLKLDHPVRKKFSARGRDSYTADETPTAGRGVGGQSYDQLTTYALLGHNAHAILGESVGIRGSKNDEFWRAYQAGEKPPPPKVPFVFERLRTYLNGAGVDMKQHGNVMQFLPMTPGTIRDRSNGEITKASLIKSKNLAEEKGGLFDVGVTGGLKGDRWAHIDLGERLPQPLYEKVVRDITGIKVSDYYGLIAHTRHLEPDGSFTDTAGEATLTGDAAFKKLLSFDVDEKLKDVKKRLETAVGSDKNKLNRAATYLRGLKITKLDPYEAYTSDVIPVVPPKYRTITEMQNGALKVADANLLYRDVVLTKQALADSKKSGMPGEHQADARTALYRSISALVGTNTPLTHRSDREDAKGFIDVIKGTENKNGLFQRLVARRRNDFSGRSTIEPDANLGVDEIGLPADMAWKIYEPTVVRRLAQAGWKPVDAMQEVKNRTAVAKGALDEEMRTRPVIYNRAPSLHRWSVNAAMPSITPGKEIRISPAVVDPMGADFDGDTMSVIVPITDAAKREASTLLPSNNLLYDKDRKLAYGLSKDVILGLFMLTTPGAPSGKTYDTPADAIKAYWDNKDNLKMGSMVSLKGQSSQQAVGWLIFEQLVPPRFMAGVTAPIDGKKLSNLLTTIAKQSPGDYNLIAKRIAQAGFTAAALSGGLSATVNELAIPRQNIKRLLTGLQAKIDKAGTLDQKREVALKGANEIIPQIDKEVADHLASVDQGYSVFLKAKPSGKIGADSFRQMIASPILVTDINDKIVPTVITSSYGSGMTPSDYVLTLPGARKGLVSKSLSTAMPGFLAKEIAGNMGPIRITIADCGTQRGIDMMLAGEAGITDPDADLLDRHLLHDIVGTSYKRNDVVTTDMLARLRDKKVPSIWVRSPMTCEAASPPCQMCAGRSVNGELHPIGSNIGLNYGQSASERSTQLVLRVFHTGGTIGSGDSLMKGFNRFRELLSVPDIIRDQGTLADNSGTVKEITAAPQGGMDVTLSSTLHGTWTQHVNQGRKVVVKKGQQISIGDPLSDGNFRPQEIALKQGMLPAQQYVVNEARKAYQEAGAVVRKPVLEVLAAGMMRYVELTDDGGEKDLAVGDVISESVYNERHAENPHVRGVPSIPGIAGKPLLSQDLFERLNFQRLEDAVREVPAAGGTSDLTGSRARSLASPMVRSSARPRRSFPWSWSSTTSWMTSQPKSRSR